MENSIGNVGAPITATDADGDVLTYSKGEDTSDTNNINNELFKIDPKTGQLTVDNGVGGPPTVMDDGLDFENPADTGGQADPDDPNDPDITFNTYVVTIMATDSSGAPSAEVMVVVTVTDENEKPVFGTEDATTTPPENTKGAAADHAEDDGNDEIGIPLVYTLNIATYLAYNPEGGEVKLSPMGSDAGKFELNAVSPTDCAAIETGDTALPDEAAVFCKTLAFKEKPDFEAPGDSNKDNIYEVTVRATDGVMYADRKVTVKVTDSDEEGKVELSSQDALIGVELTATLKDSDGGVPAPGTFTDVVWSWHRLDTAAIDATPSAPGIAYHATTSNAIRARTGPNAYTPGSNTYTPVAADRGKYLKAMVTYTDRTRDEDNVVGNNDADSGFVGFMNDVTSVATTAVRNNPENQRPVFREGTRTARVVAENTKALAGATDDDELAIDNPADNVGGGPVMARDADPEDKFTYTLGGTDVESFRIRESGQLEVSKKASLNYEIKNEYTVVVTVKDSSSKANDTASITVTIHVTDLDEKPVITASGGGAVITGPSEASQAEGVGGVVASYSVSGGDGGTVAWRLTGSDASSFSIGGSSGVVSFKSAPDYEDQNNTDHSYTFTVNAKVSGESATPLNVTVSVTNVEEPGTVTLSTDTPRAGARITATLVDPDMFTPSNVNWQWESSAGGSSSWSAIPGATADTYMVAETDSGNYLRARASYTDGYGSDRATSEATANAVTGNTAPEFATATTERSVAENTAAGENIGAVVVATDADAGDMLAYTLGGADVASFDIDANTGQLMTSAALDYETKTTYEVVVTATDGAGATAMITVTITVTDESLGALGDTYDSNEDEMIDRDDLVAAVRAFRGNVIDRDDLVALVRLFQRTLGS